MPRHPDTDLTDLDLECESIVEAESRRRPELTAEYVRDLTAADFAAPQIDRQLAQLPSLRRIHSSHHALARCLATGMRQSDAAMVTGYTTTRIMQLERDPLFQSLLADYRSEAKSVFADFGERMRNISMDAIELLQERLHDNPGDFSVGVLLDVIKSMADRTGYGPGQEVTFKMDQNVIDRPPRETHEEWLKRRERELAEPDPETAQRPKETLQ